MKVSLCKIVRNEAQNLAACLEPVTGIVDEIVIVDTGSMDDTKAIAQRFGARVFDFAWCDDFAAARNESIRHARGKWIFWLDADDRVPPASVRALGDLFGRLRDDMNGYLMNVVSPAPDGVPNFEHLHVRLFPNDARIRWQLRVHEQIAPSILAVGGALIPTKIPIVHVGYAGGQATVPKLERNLRLADLDCADHPTLAAAHYSRAITLLGLGRSAEALVALNVLEAFAAEELIQRTLPLLRANALVMENELGQALDVVRAARAQDPSGARLLMLETRLLAATGDLAGAEASARAQLVIDGEHHAFGIYDRAGAEIGPRHLLAETLLVQERFLEAAEQAATVIAIRPTYGGAWLTRGEALLRGGDGGAFEEHRARLAAMPNTDVACGLLDVERFIVGGAHPDADARLASVAPMHAGTPIVLRARARLLHARGDRGDSLDRAVRAALAADPLCIRTRAIERITAAPSVVRSVAHRRWVERAATALSPLVTRD